MIATLVGRATVGETKAAAAGPVADRTDIDASLAITISVTPAMRPRGKVQTPARDCLEGEKRKVIFKLIQI